MVLTRNDWVVGGLVTTGAHGEAKVGDGRVDRSGRVLRFEKGCEPHGIRRPAAAQEGVALHERLDRVSKCNKPRLNDPGGVLKIVTQCWDNRFPQRWARDFTTDSLIDGQRVVRAVHGRGRTAERRRCDHEKQWCRKINEIKDFTDTAHPRGAMFETQRHISAKLSGNHTQRIMWHIAAEVTQDGSSVARTTPKTSFTRYAFMQHDLCR